GDKSGLDRYRRLKSPPAEPSGSWTWGRSLSSAPHPDVDLGPDLSRVLDLSCLKINVRHCPGLNHITAALCCCRNCDLLVFCRGKCHLCCRKLTTGQILFLPGFILRLRRIILICLNSGICSFPPDLASLKTRTAPSQCSASAAAQLHVNGKEIFTTD
ncbi:hypothetical protein H1C71_006934, partial [Ictidomys tridecemlineatus]